MKWLWLFAVVAACGGSTSKKNPDAQTGHDGSAVQMDAPADVPVDAPPAPITAIGAGSTPQIVAPGNFKLIIPYQSDYDDLSEWSNLGIFTAKHPGDYLLCASLFLGGTYLHTTFDLELDKNGAKETILAQGAGIASGCRAVRLATNDMLSVLLVNSGAQITIPPDDNWNWLTIEQVTETVDAETSAAFSSPNGQFVQIPYDTATLDDGLYSTTTHQLTATTAGDFQVCASIGLGNVGLEGEIDVFVNATREKAISNGVVFPSGCRSVRLAANDAIDVRLFQSNNNLTIPRDVNNADWLDIQKQPLALSVSAIASFDTTTQTFAPVAYTTVDFDAGHEFDTTTHTFTAATAGDYQVCASVLVPNSTVDGDEIDIFKNGTREKGISYGHFGLSGCRVMRLVAGDQVQIQTYTTANKSFTNDPNWDWFEVSKLH